MCRGAIRVSTRVFNVLEERYEASGRVLRACEERSESVSIASRERVAENVRTRTKTKHQRSVRIRQNAPRCLGGVFEKSLNAFKTL